MGKLNAFKNTFVLFQSSELTSYLNITYLFTESQIPLTNVNRSTCVEVV